MKELLLLGKRNKKGFFQLLVGSQFALFMVFILLIASVGGFGAVYGLFKGIGSIPPAVLIGLSVVGVLVLLRK